MSDASGARAAKRDLSVEIKVEEHDFGGLKFLRLDISDSRGRNIDSVDYETSKEEQIVVMEEVSAQ